MQSLRSKLSQPRTRTKEPQMSRQEIRSELKQVKKEAIAREKAIVGKLIQNATVILGTCVGASSYLLREKEFDLVIVDEAAQSLEAACWIPILKASRCVLAGDHCQLPPTIKSKEAEKGGLNQTLFEKLILDARFGTVVKLLNTQYRMNDLISSWASVNMYNGHVLSDSSVANHTLIDLLPSQFKPSALTEEELLEDYPVMLLIDTSSTCMYEDAQDSESHRNVNEANIIMQHAAYLVQHGIKPCDIGVITPYNGQLELLRDMFRTYADSGNSSSSASKVNFDGIEIKTIDGFQGGEKECILISLVRSNEGKKVGFLGEKRRINVAITRAKRHVAVVCDSETCSSDKFIKTLLTHIEDNGQVMPVEMYLDQHNSIECSVDLPSKPSSSGKTTASSSTSNASGKNDKKKDNKPNQKLFSSNNNSAKQSSTKTGNSNSVGGKAEAGKGNTGKVETKEEDAMCQKIREILQLYKSAQLNHGSLIFAPEGSLPSLQFKHLLLNGSLVADLPSSKQVLLFPTEVSSFHRLFVHQVSEELKLKHVSVGEGDQRQISVSLTTPMTSKAESVRPTDSKTELKTVEVPLNDDKKFHVDTDEEEDGSNEKGSETITKDTAKLDISSSKTASATMQPPPVPDNDKAKLQQQNQVRT